MSDERRLRLLFLCTGNACRSQMAEGWARHLHGDWLEAHSAGIVAHGLDPLAVRAMAEHGIDISGHRSKRLDELDGIAFDWVISVCDNARDSCPTLPGATGTIHRPFDDPPALARTAASEAQAFAHYRRVCAGIGEWVRGMPGRLERL